MILADAEENNFHFTIGFPMDGQPCRDAIAKLK